MKQYSVYIITNKNNTVLYTGVTSNLVKRVYQHKTKYYKKSFTSKYNCDKLVYFETYQSSTEAIIREKQIKSGNRSNKLTLIKKENPEWADLSTGWIFDI